MKRLPGYKRRRPTSEVVTPFLLRLPAKLKQTLDAEAASRRISLAAYVREVLAGHLKKIRSRRTT